MLLATRINSANTASPGLVSVRQSGDSTALGYQVWVPNAEAGRATHGQTWRNPTNGAAQESNLPSLGLPDLTGFEDRLGHRARPLRGRW
jgi:hypothetical protein